MIAFLIRLRAWLWQMFLCIDQLFGTWLRGWHYVWLGGDKPRADETISSWVGRRAIQGRRWALIAERIIDGIFFWDPAHCRRAAHREREELDD